MAGDGKISNLFLQCRGHWQGLQLDAGVVDDQHPPEGRSLGFILEVVQDLDELASSNPGAGVVKNLGLSHGDEGGEAKVFRSHF